MYYYFCHNLLDNSPSHKKDLSMDGKHLNSSTHANSNIENGSPFNTTPYM